MSDYNENENKSLEEAAEQEIVPESEAQQDLKDEVQESEVQQDLKDEVQESEAQQDLKSDKIQQDPQPNLHQTYSWMQNRRQSGQDYRQQGGPAGQQAGQQAGQGFPQGGQYYGQPQNGYRQNQHTQQAGQHYQQTAWNSQQQYNYYQRQQAAQQNRQYGTNRNSSSGKHWGTVVAMALVFGLIAGTVTFGVNKAASVLFPTQRAQTEASAGAEEKQETHLSVTGSGASDTAEAPAAASGTKTVAQVANDAMPSLVTISTMSVQEMRSFFGTQQFEAKGAGTGVIVGENDTELLIATNNHVIEGAQEVSIGFIDENVAEAQIKGTDAHADLAIVAVKLEDIPDETMSEIKIAVIGDSDELVLGDQVVAIGNALGVGQSVTSGYVSALDRELDLSDGFTNFTSTGLIQTDAAINSGNSGGALLNMKGELIGINEAKSAYTSSGVTVDNVGYAIPMSKAQPILEELMNQVTREKYSEDEQGYLGVSLVNISTEFAELYGTPQGVGFAEVAEGSPADEAGAMKGDILTEFDGKTVTSVDEVLNEIQYYRQGEEVELKILRADNGEYKEMTLTVTLGTKDAISSLQPQ